MSQLKTLSTMCCNDYSENGFTKVNHAIFSDQDYLKLKSLVESILVKEIPEKKSSAVSDVFRKYPQMLFWILSDNVLDIAEDLLGPNIGLWTTSIFFKKARSPEAAYWHKDIAGVYKFDLFENKNLINLTLSLSDSDSHTGCLRYLPGTHKIDIKHDYKAPVNDLITNNNAIDPAQLSQFIPVAVPLKENEASAHNINVVHGSEANTSDRDRLSISFRFFSASSVTNLDSFAKNQIRQIPYLVRGEDITGSGLKRLQIR